MNLFDLDESSSALSIKESEVSHRMIAQLLYVSKRDSLGIQLSVDFYSLMFLAVPKTIGGNYNSIWNTYMAPLIVS
jgi:hypothetical protein